MLFIVIFLGMVRHDVRKWWRVKRSKAKRELNAAIAPHETTRLFFFFVHRVIPYMLYIYQADGVKVPLQQRSCLAAAHVRCVTHCAVNAAIFFIGFDRGTSRAVKAYYLSKKYYTFS